MKKTVLSLVAALAFGAVAESEVKSTAMLGLTIITNTSEYLPLAIRYDAKVGVPATVADVVQTSTLAEGDKLYVYDHDRSRYDTYVLAADKTWTPVSVVVGDAEYTPAPASQTQIKKGYGFWLQRGESSRTNDVYLLGLLANQAEFTVARGKTKATHTLLGVAKDTDLSLTPTNPFRDAVAGDEIHVPQDNGLRIYRFSTKNDRWFSPMGGDVKPLPSGSVYWYVRKAGAAAFTMTMELSDDQ